MSNKPTLTHRVAKLEDAHAITVQRIDSVDLKTAYTEVNVIQLAEDARKARQDARSASIIAAGALFLGISICILEAFR